MPACTSRRGCIPITPPGGARPWPPRSERARRIPAAAAREVPDELILLETDAPYLAPVPHRRQPNEPAYVMDTLRHVADLRGTSPDALEALVERNAAQAFPRTA